MSDLYERIDKLCKKNGISITAMCKGSGVSRGSMTDLKNGRSQNLSTDAISKIASYFQVSIDHLLGGEENEKPPVDSDEELMEYLQMLKTRHECRMLFQVSKNATKEDVEAAVRIIEALRNK